MKKLLLLSLALCIGFYANAQKTAKVPAHLLNKSEKMVKELNGEELTVIINEANPFLKPTNPSKDLGVQIGNTYYDLQGNADIGNRMLVYADQSISAVWTFAPNNTAGYPDRGTGFNLSTDGGTNWGAQPTVRIEGSTTKTGWPNVNRLNDGSFVVTAHGYSPTQGAFSKSTDNGTTWITTQMGGQTLGLVWCRMVTIDNKIHVIGHTVTTSPYAGFAAGALVYVNSTDGGTTWSNPVIPTGLDTSNYNASVGFNDAYSFAGKGSTLAIVYGDAFRTPCLVKSTDSGANWSYTEILHQPVKKFDSEGSTIYDINGDAQQDNVFGSDGVNYAMIDNSGKVHAFFGRMCDTDDGSGAGYSYFPYTDGIYYWNEDMGTIPYVYRWRDISGVNTYEGLPDTVAFPIITEVVDINNNGVLDLPDNGSEVPFGPYYCSISSFPVAVIVPDGTITLFYSSLVEGTDGTVGSEHRAFRNVWEIHKYAGAPNNFTWSTPVRVASDDFTEEVWPCVSPVTTSGSGFTYAHLWYQGDGYPGNALQPSSGNVHPITENTIYYVKTEAYTDGINEINVVKTAPVVYPNPASNNVTVMYNLTDATNVTLSIYNLVGQQIMTTSQNVAAGEVSVALNIESLTKGVYFIKSQIGSKDYTNKLIVK